MTDNPLGELHADDMPMVKPISYTVMVRTDAGNEVRWGLGWPQNEADPFQFKSREEAEWTARNINHNRGKVCARVSPD